MTIHLIKVGTKVISSVCETDKNQISNFLDSTLKKAGILKFWSLQLGEYILERLGIQTSSPFFKI